MRANGERRAHTRLVRPPSSAARARPAEGDARFACVCLKVMCIMAFGNSLLRIDGAGVPPPIRHTAMCYGAAAADAVRHGFLLDSIERCAPVGSSTRSTRMRVSTHGQTSGPPWTGRCKVVCRAPVGLAIRRFPFRPVWACGCGG